MNNEKEKLRDPSLLCASLISKLIEHARLDKEPSGQLLQAVWRSLDTVTHQGQDASDFAVSFHFATTLLFRT